MLSELASRGDGKCEICQASDDLNVFQVPESPDNSVHSHVYICALCESQIATNESLDLQHLRCLTNSMWSSTQAVQVLSYRLLHKCTSEPWAQDALDIMYLDDSLKDWALAGMTPEREPCLDVNGVALQAGDAVTIIKDLDVKGANFTAKRGTAVRNIGLSDNPLHIEGRVNGQRIVIIAAYTKKN
jgi:protein PhnA